MCYKEVYSERWHEYIIAATALQVVGTFAIEDNPNSLNIGDGPNAVELLCLCYGGENFSQE